MRRDLLFGAPSWVLPGASLDIDFVHSRAWVRGGGACDIADLLACSRASPGYVTMANGLLVPVGSNALARGDQGLAAWQASTNLVLQSQNFGTNWGALPSGGVDAVQSGIAPDGSATAWQLREASPGATIRQLQSTSNITITPGDTYTLSAFAQAGTLGFFQASLVSGANFFFATGSLSGAGSVTEAAAGGTGTVVASSIQTLANGWHRLSVTGTLPTTPAQLRLTLTNSGMGGFGPDYTGTGTGYVSIWGAQLENLAFATPYIPTTAATVTRAGDVITLQEVGLTAALASQSARFVTNGVQGIDANLWLPNSTNELWYESTTTANVIATGGAGTSAAIGNSGTISGLVKAVFSYNATGNAAIANGGTLTTNLRAWGGTTGSTNALFNYNAIFKFNGYARRVSFSPRYGAFDCFATGSSAR